MVSTATEAPVDDDNPVAVASSQVQESDVTRLMPLLSNPMGHLATHHLRQLVDCYRWQALTFCLSGMGP